MSAPGPPASAPGGPPLLAIVLAALALAFAAGYGLGVDRDRAELDRLRLQAAGWTMDHRPPGDAP